MQLLIGALLFIFGSIIASFIGVVSGRLYTNQSILNGRSRCDACNTKLPPFALVPILSYLIYRGRAHCCGSRISLIAPISEILLGLLFVLSYLHLGLTLELIFFLSALSILLALVLYDLAHQILPPSLLTVFVVLSVITGFIGALNSNEFFNSVFVAFIIATSLALIHFFSRGRAMGLADAPLAFGLAILVGSNAFSGFIFSFWIGAVVGIILLARRPSGSRIGVEVPFAPFLAAGFLLAYFTEWNPFVFIATLSIL